MMSEKTLEESLKNIKNSLEAKAEKAIPTLPWWPDDKRGAPNAFLRSALFAAVQGKDRRYLDGEILVSLDGIRIKFTGKQLNQTDLDVWEAILQLARPYPLGTVSQFSSYEILKMLSLPIGSSQYRQLFETINRLAAGLINITNNGKRKGYMSHLVMSALTDQKTDPDKNPPEKYQIQLDKNLIHLFGQADWTALDWDQRKQVRNKPLAQGLHAFYSSHQKPFPLKVETLHGLVGSNNGEMRGFKRQLKIALDILKDIGFLKDYRIEDDLIHVERSSIALKT